MSRRSEMIAKAQADAQAQAEQTNTQPTERVLRPTINFPSTMTLWSPSFYAGTETKQPQVSGWSHELGMFVRIFGPLAEKIEAAHDPETGEPLFRFARHNGVDSGTKGRPITLEIRENGNGLLFEATEEFPNCYASANEASIKRVKPGVPDTLIG